METQWLEAPAEEPDCRTVYRHGKLCPGSDLGWLSGRLWGRHVHSLRRGWRLGAPVAVTTKLPLMPQELGLLPRSVSLGVGLKRTAARFCLAGSSVLPPCSRQERSLAFRCSRDGQASGDANCGISCHLAIYIRQITLVCGSQMGSWLENRDISPLGMPQPPPQTAGWEHVTEVFSPVPDG